MQKIIHVLILLFILSNLIQGTFFRNFRYKGFSALESNECFYAWAEKEKSTVNICKTSTDCDGPTSKCIYSPITSNYVCCHTKPGAILPSNFL